MIDISALSGDDRFEYAVDYAIRHAFEDLEFYLSDMDLEDKVTVASTLLSLLAKLES